MSSVHDIETPNEEYTAMSRFWHLTASLRGGTPTMRQAGRMYLPQEPGESEEAYKNRLDRSVLTNLYKKTVDKMVGKPLKKGVKAGEDVPPDIAVYFKDFDNQGTNIDVFATRLLTAAIDDGVTHVLVDYNNLEGIVGQFPDGSLTVEQEKLYGVRPYAKHITASDLIGWQYEYINNRRVLTQIRIREFAKINDPQNPYLQKTVERIRVVEPGLVEVWERIPGAVSDAPNKTQEDQWRLVESTATTMPIIPLITFYTNRTGFMIGEPLLLDVAYLNVAHWQSDSDQRNILHIARVPILFATGFGEDDSAVNLEIGTNTFVKAPQGADLKYVEHTGKGIGSGHQDLQDLVLRIQMLGMELMIKRPSGNVTATARALDQVEADSPLGIIAKELENALGKVLDLFGAWLKLGADAGGTVEVFKDFGIESEDLEDIRLLIDARREGDISQMTFWKELRRRGLLSDDFDPQTEVSLLDIESGGNAGSVSQTAETQALLPPGQGVQEQEAERRNRVGDTTATAHGHSHTLEVGGTTSAYTDQESGETHTHTWDEMGIRTSVDDGHSHVLLVRAAAGSYVGVSNNETTFGSENIGQEGAEAAVEGTQ